MKREVADGVTIVGEFPWSMSVLTGRSNFNPALWYHHADTACGPDCPFPELVLTDADVAAIPVFLMVKKETHGTVLGRN